MRIVVGVVIGILLGCGYTGVREGIFHAKYCRVELSHQWYTNPSDGMPYKIHEEICPFH
jgi:hypothetical protein